MSSTERQLLALYYFIVTFAQLLANKRVAVYSDSQNAVTICSKGSAKPRLHA
jgi:hypothetical protein